MQLALIPYSLKRDSMPQRVADSIHAYGVILESKASALFFSFEVDLQRTSPRHGAKVDKKCTSPLSDPKRTL
jgi:hypothetical protein